MKLYHRDLGGEGNPSLVILHGLLGSSRNWRAAGAKLSRHFHVRALDLRNHGRSPHSSEQTFSLMAEDLIEWLDDHGLAAVHLMGHSLGGKVAMKVACTVPRRVTRLLVVDVAPKDYPLGSLELDAMCKIDLAMIKLRREAEEQLSREIPDVATRRFLLTNLSRHGSGALFWHANLPILASSMSEMRRSPLGPQDRFDGPSLFLLGGRSRFVLLEDQPVIRRHFPRAETVVLTESGHNPHVDDVAGLVRSVVRFALRLDHPEATREE